MDNPTPKVKGIASKFKGLPPWAYVAAIGVGGTAIWFGISRSRANEAAAADDISGTSDSALSATTAGDAYPVGSQGAGYYYDPTTGTTDQGSFDNIQDFLELVGTFQGLTGGGTQPSAAPEDHYTPPAITINIPDSAIPSAPAQATPAAKVDTPVGKAPDNCKGEFPFTQDNGSRKGQCYKVVLKDGKKYRFYKNGDKVLA